MAILTRETTATGVTNNNAPLTNAELDNNFVELVADIADKAALTDLSVTTNAAGTAALSYSNSTGTFTYTPPDLSGYQTSAALNEDIDDRVAALLQAGNGIALDYDDVNNELAISSEVTEITAYNGTGSTLTKGTVVYQSGVQGTDISVAAASNSSASTMPAVGIVIADIANAATGQIAVAGLVRNLDTTSFTAGDVLYVGTSGALTATKPTGESNLIQNFGRALKINASSGEVLVLGAGRTNDVPNLADGNVFIGNASNVAEKRALAAGDIASGTFADARIAESNVTQHQAALSITESQISDFGTYLTTVALNDVSDVVITSLSSGQILKYNGTNWVNDADAGGIALTDLSVTTNTAGTAALSYNNTSGVFSYTPPDLSSYLTSYTETDTLDSVTGRGATTTNAVTVGNLTSTGIDDNATSTAITIDSSQNVGIGTDTPGTALHIKTDDTAGGNIAFFDESGTDSTGRIQILSTGGTANDFMRIGSVNRSLQLGTAATGHMTINNVSGDVGIGVTDPDAKLEIFLADNDTSTYFHGGGLRGLKINDETISNDGDHTKFNKGSGTGTYSFHNSNGELMRITSDGGVTNAEYFSLSNGAKMTVGGNSQFTDFLGGSSNGTSDDGAFFFYGGRAYNQGAGVGVYGDDHPTFAGQVLFKTSGFSTTVTIDTSGNLTATGNITAYSDQRLKSEIKTLDGSKVYEMRGVSFTKDGAAGSGVIAQELQKVAPELVHESGEYLSVAYGNLVGYLIEAVKELKAEIEELKNASSK